MAASSFQKYLNAAQETLANSISDGTKAQVTITEVFYHNGFAIVHLKYKRCWKNWQNFCAVHEIQDLDAEDMHLLAYLAFVAETCR